MEKLRRIFPVLLVLVLVLGIMIVPASADCPVVDGTCPCCGSSNITLDFVSTPEDDAITVFVCYSCCYAFTYFQGTDSYFEDGICTWEWCIDKENGNHYQYCSKCTNKKNEGPHFLKNCTRIEGTDTHQGTCPVCGAEVIVDCSGGTATCVAKAVCEFCGQEYGEIAADNHNWDKGWTIDPDLGIHYHKCLNDGCTGQSAAAIHNVESWTPVEGTDTHQGTCTECGATVTEEHNVMDWIPVEGTSNHQGTCTICGKKEITVPHDYSLIRNDETGHWNECVCGLKETEPQAHVWGDTYFTDGETHWQVCTICDWESTHEEHQYNPMKKDDEHHILTCVCGATAGEAVPHEYGNWTHVEETTNTHKRVCACGAEETGNCSGGTATCVNKAVCDICGEEYGDFDLTNHDLEHHDAKPATCTEVGWEAYDTCKREGCGYTTCKEIAVLGHDIEHHDAKPATCTEDGWPAYDTCKREGCNYTTLLMMQARLGHDLTHHEGKAATCTEAGWEAYDTCKREGCDYTTYKEIPALGHDLVKHDAKAPTCTEAGWDAYDTCSRCSYTTYREIAAPGHIPGEPVVTAREEPQVGKAGSVETMTYCTVCGLDLEYSYNQLPALPEPVPVPDTKEEGTGKPDAEIVIAPKKSVLRIIQPEFREEEQELELSVIQQFFSDDSGVYFQTEPDSVLPNIPPYALKLIEAKVWRLEKFSDLSDRVSLDYTGSQEFPLNLDLIMILVYRDDAGEHWEVLKKPTRLFGNRLRAEVDAALVRKLQSRPFAIIVLADNGSR